MDLDYEREPLEFLLNDLEWLRQAIRERRMMKRWEECSPLVDADEVKGSLAREKALQAEATLQRIMNSRANNGSRAYQLWAIDEALELGDQWKRAAPASGRIFCHRPTHGMAKFA